MLSHRQRRGSQRKTSQTARTSLKERLRLETHALAKGSRFSIHSQNPEAANLVFEQIQGEIASLQINDKSGSTVDLVPQKTSQTHGDSGQVTSPPQVWRTELGLNPMLSSRVQRHQRPRVPSARGPGKTRDCLIIK